MAFLGINSPDMQRLLWGPLPGARHDTALLSEYGIGPQLQHLDHVREQTGRPSLFLFGYKGFADTDVRHNFSANWAYELPWGKDLSGVTRALTPRPTRRSPSYTAIRAATRQPECISHPGCRLARPVQRLFQRFDSSLRASD